MSMRLGLAVALAALVLLSGCAGVTDALNKIPGVEVHRESQRDGTVVESEDQSVPCRESREDLVAVAGVDVDTAYVRLKRFFDYPTLAERKRGTGGWIDSGFRHETTPGARYWMKDSVDFKVGVTVQTGWLSTEVERDGAGSVVRLRYCIGGSEGFAGGPGFPDFLAHKVRLVAAGRAE